MHSAIVLILPALSQGASLLESLERSSRYKVNGYPRCGYDKGLVAAGIRRYEMRRVERLNELSLKTRHPKSKVLEYDCVLDSWYNKRQMRRGGGVQYSER